MKFGSSRLGSYPWGGGVSSTLKLSKYIPLARGGGKVMSLLITDIKLPERETATILSFLESNNMPARVPDGFGWDFNCWGFTAYYCQWEEKAFWMEQRQIERHLREHTKPISKAEVKAGDVAVFYSGQYLTHTAIVLPSGSMVCHKPGAQTLCIDTIDAAVRSYGNVVYARPTKKVQKEFDNSAECDKVGA
jgi:cell wall-associated NlpC family hydrolase